MLPPGRQMRMRHECAACKMSIKSDHDNSLGLMTGLMGTLAELQHTGNASHVRSVPTHLSLDV